MVNCSNSSARRVIKVSLKTSKRFINVKRRKQCVKGRGERRIVRSSSENGSKGGEFLDGEKCDPNEAEMTIVVAEALGWSFQVSEISGFLQKRLSGNFDREVAFAPADGASGGLISLWDQNMFEVCSIVVLRRMIALKGRLLFNNMMTGLINVYGSNVQGERRDFFENLIAIISDWNIPVIVGGDFNVVRKDSERLGIQVQSVVTRIFEEFIAFCQLIEVPNTGSQFTCLFPQLVQFSLPRRLSDHKPIVLKERRLKKFIRPFKWFNHWADDSILANTISDLCDVNRGKGMNKILQLIKNATKERERAVREMNLDSAKEIRNKIDSSEVKSLSNPTNAQIQSEITMLKSRLWSVMRNDERDWLQKSRLRWFKEGDRNTKFFHLSAISRVIKIRFLSCWCRIQLSKHRLEYNKRL
ncbi:uncharacterized protein LOC120149294 [Hibiscus syriacus]|uniref:uncharacterized protein LOC120149294 n=1 Tax=Hibiscus syriacus TaxID=106335 RepID=UPI001921AFE0|nr:uncharacterized protein LOC120149294 [Hibiscus syriacus]